MAATKYTYPFSSFPDDEVNADKLEDEIQASAITGDLKYITTISEVECDIWFEDALSAEDQTLLDDVVAAHDGQPYPTVVPVSGEDVEISQTTSENWEDKVVVATPVYPAGTYTVEWSAELNSSKSNSEAQVRVSVDGQAEEISSGGTNSRTWLPCSGIGEITFSDTGVKTLRLQFKRSSSANKTMAAGIRRAFLKISRNEV
jgi:hypothetical protein